MGASGSLTKALALGLKHLFVKHYYTHFYKYKCMSDNGGIQTQEWPRSGGGLNEMASYLWHVKT